MKTIEEIVESVFIFGLNSPRVRSSEDDRVEAAKVRKEAVNLLKQMLKDTGVVGAGVFMHELVIKMLNHTEKRKQEYWGRDEKIYKFYEGQNVCCRDLLLQYEAEQSRKPLGCEPSDT